MRCSFAVRRSGRYRSGRAQGGNARQSELRSCRRTAFRPHRRDIPRIRTARSLCAARPVPRDSDGVSPARCDGARLRGAARREQAVHWRTACLSSLRILASISGCLQMAYSMKAMVFAEVSNPAMYGPGQSAPGPARSRRAPRAAARHRRSGSAGDPRAGWPCDMPR